MKNEQYKEAVNSLAQHMEIAYAIVVGATYRDVSTAQIPPFL